MLAVTRYGLPQDGPAIIHWPQAVHLVLRSTVMLTNGPARLP